MYYFNKEGLYPPTHGARLEATTSHRDISRWEEVVVLSSCAHIVIVIYEAPALGGLGLGAQSTGSHEALSSEWVPP